MKKNKKEMNDISFLALRENIEAYDYLFSKVVDYNKAFYSVDFEELNSHDIQIIQEICNSLDLEFNIELFESYMRFFFYESIIKGETSKSIHEVEFIFTVNSNDKRINFWRLFFYMINLLKFANPDKLNKLIVYFTEKVFKVFYLNEKINNNGR